MMTTRTARFFVEKGFKLRLLQEENFLWPSIINQCTTWSFVSVVPSFLYSYILANISPYIHRFLAKLTGAGASNLNMLVHLC